MVVTSASGSIKFTKTSPDRQKELMNAGTQTLIANMNSNDSNDYQKGQKNSLSNALNFVMGDCFSNIV